MNEWTRRQLAPVRAATCGVTVVIDPDSLVSLTDLSGQVEVVNDWWSLRAIYERDGRRRADESPPLVLIIRPPMSASDVPWDIEQLSIATVTIRLPGPETVRAAFRELDNDEFDRAAPAVTGATTEPAESLLRAVTGISLGQSSALLADQLRLAARIALRSSPSPQLARIASTWITDPVLTGLLEIPPDCSALQQVWVDFIETGGGEWANVLTQAKPEVAALFAGGLLQSIVSAGSVNNWANIGIRRPSAEERARELLDAAPTTLPANAADWHDIAAWWGDVRRLIAQASVDLRDAAWATWAELNDAFAAWLRAHYGVLLTSAAAFPVAVHRIGSFLARRLREGTTERVLLVVLDGLGHTQWRHLLERLPLDVLDAGSTLALVPTYTTVSRQAIFAGQLPTSFPDTLWTTNAEARRWRDHWSGEGIPVDQVAYHRVRGRLPDDRIEFGNTRVGGVVVNAVDDLMHTSELFGDAQLLAGIEVWIDNGFLVDLISRASAEGIETWITADHGNLECHGIGAISEGVAIEAAGKRLIRYPNKTLRAASSAQGVVWDNIPGLPTTAEPLLFAEGRTAFTNNRVSVSHGGLSIDEMFVPLARVTT